MKTINIYTKTTLFIATIIFLLTLSSCKVTYVPSFDSVILEQIESTSKSVDKFYLLMLENSKSENEGRRFENYVEQYVEIEIEITSLLNKNKVRPLNKHSIRICEITLGIWQKYKEEHRNDNTITDGEIKLNRIYLNDLFFAMQVAEKANDIVNKSQQ